VRALARAKLTLSLRVVGRRPDGYHDLEALVVSLADPHDVVEVELAESGISLALDGPAATGVPAGEDNLALRAARRVLEEAGKDTGLQLRLTKEIPAGAGLGGGSADAAAVLVTGAELLGVDPVALPALAADLGSDVPFCLTGGLTWMRGRGELLEPLTALGTALPLAVVIPPFAISTAAVYQAWDDLGGPRSERAVPAPAAVAVHLSELVNDLEPAAEAVEPRLRPFRQALEDLAGAPALLAGSGSACVVFLPSPKNAESMAALAAARLHATTFATHPVPHAP
jgi:4-diphosphocytidyl-2-C-methyl-D-erythritol kinase